MNILAFGDFVLQLMVFFSYNISGYPTLRHQAKKIIYILLYIIFDFFQIYCRI